MKISNLLQFRDFYQSVSKKELPIKTAYKLSKLFKSINDSLEFYQTKFSEIIQEYGEHDDEGNLVNDGQNIKIISGKELECTKKMTELNDLDIDLPDIKFNLTEFENINISVEDMTTLFPFIEE